MRSCKPNSIRPCDKNRDTDDTDIRDKCIDANEADGAEAEEVTEEDKAPVEGKEEAEVEGEDAECQECDPKNTDKKVRSPGTPSAEERALHELTHWPFRSWCDACVRGRATGQQHRSMVGEYAESNVARVLMDYGFLHEEEAVTETEHGRETESKLAWQYLLW